MKRMAYFLVLVLFLATTSMALAKDHGDLAYAVSASAQFGVVNPETGGFTLIGTTSSALSGIALGPHDVIYGLDANNNLVIINPANATTTVVGNIGLPVQSNGNVTLMTSLGKGKLFAVDPNNDLYSINSQTGLATKIGSTGIPVPDFANGDVTANSLAGAEGYLYLTWAVDNNAGVSITPSTLYRIDSHTGKAIAVGLTDADNAAIVGSGFIDDTLYGFTFGAPDNQPNRILSIDLETGAATVVTNQAANLDPVFGAIPARKLPHHTH
ncbi:MAG: hypothetical protein DLM73_01795 [Chthoniobacterales bacterium]|nr:MAG: hypothetical protein DLM73_01795 [Chthoniobacterales bacterium]